MTRYNVQVTRTTTRRVWIEVEAYNDAEARLKALDKAGDINFYEGTESTPEYDVEDVQEVGS